MIKRAKRSDAARLLSAMTLGFSADPFMRWLYPEPQQFLSVFPKVLDLYGGKAFEQGSAYCNDDLTAGALWLPPGIHPDEDGLMACFEETVASEKHKSLFAAFDGMDKHHPDEPCWHLAMVAVDPVDQGKGQGSALMTESLKACDHDGRQIYLESTNRANLSLYRRYGFADLEVIETPDAPPVFPMLRKSH